MSSSEVKKLEEAHRAYHEYIDQYPYEGEFLRFHEFARNHYGVPEEIAKEYWNNV